LVDYATCHLTLDLTNVCVEFLPKKTISFLQPLDAGIIQNFKVNYKALFLRWLLDQIESYGPRKLDLLSAIHAIIEAWSRVTVDTMRNCWCHTQIMPAPLIALFKRDSDPTNQTDVVKLESLIGQLNLEDPLNAKKFADESFDYESYDDSEIEIEDNIVEEEEANQPLNTREALLCANQLKLYMKSQGKFTLSEIKVIERIANQCRDSIATKTIQRQRTLHGYFIAQ
jgi:hypothetical protein